MGIYKQKGKLLEIYKDIPNFYDKLDKLFIELGITEELPNDKSEYLSFCDELDITMEYLPINSKVYKIEFITEDYNKSEFYLKCKGTYLQKTEYGYAFSVEYYEGAMSLLDALIEMCIEKLN